jgi:hypothetical protein
MQGWWSGSRGKNACLASSNPSATKKEKKKIYNVFND